MPSRPQPSFMDALARRDERGLVLLAERSALMAVRRAGRQLAEEIARAEAESPGAAIFVEKRVELGGGRGAAALGGVPCQACAAFTAGRAGTPQPIGSTFDLRAPNDPEGRQILLSLELRLVFDPTASDLPRQADLRSVPEWQSEKALLEKLRERVFELWSEGAKRAAREAWELEDFHRARGAWAARGQAREIELAIGEPANAAAPRPKARRL